MEKTWYQKLMAACTDHYMAIDKEKSDAKIAELLNTWEKVTESALSQAAGIEFKEILSWLGAIAPKLQNSYANVLKGSAATPRDSLLAVMLASDIDEVIETSTKAEVAMLAEIAEAIISENLPREKARNNFLAAVNNRPDILTLFKGETFAKFTLYDYNAHFLKNDKLDLLLNCFQSSKDYKDFSKKIKSGERFAWYFNNDTRIVSSWDHVSDVELQDSPTPKKAVEIYQNSTKSWKMSLGNFKKVLSLMDNESFGDLIPLIVNDFDSNSFYCEVAVVAWENLIEELIGDKSITLLELQKLHYRAPGDNKISHIKRKIIQKFLE
jgi:hypothetical protein